MKVLDDKDRFTSTEEQKADMELTMFRTFIDDIWTGRVWFKPMEQEGKHKFIKQQLVNYSNELDRAITVLVWNG